MATEMMVASEAMRIELPSQSRNGVSLISEEYWPKVKGSGQKIEARWLVGAPALAIEEPRTQPKLFLSKTLVDGQIRDVYSELMSLDV